MSTEIQAATYCTSLYKTWPTFMYFIPLVLSFKLWTHLDIFVALELQPNFWNKQPSLEKPNIGNKQNWRNRTLGKPTVNVFLHSDPRFVKTKAKNKCYIVLKCICLGLQQIKGKIKSRRWETLKSTRSVPVPSNI